MCDPVTMTVLAVASTGVGLYAQNEQASAQRDLIKGQAKAEREEARDRAEEELGDRVRANREARARARVAAGESGAMGASFAASINQSLADQDTEAALIQKNLQFSQRATGDRELQALTQARGVSALEAGLQLGSAGLQGYNTGLGLKAKATTPKKAAPPKLHK